MRTIDLRGYLVVLTLAVILLRCSVQDVAESIDNAAAQAAPKAKAP